MSDSPLRLVVESDDEGGACLCCPVCGDDHVHPAGVMVEQGRTRTEVSCESTAVVPTTRGEMCRGSLISLRFWCEQGHAFRYRYEFHKGRLACELATAPVEEGRRPAELWRN